MNFITWIRSWTDEDAEETIEVDADTKEEAEYKAFRRGYIMMMEEKNGIRHIIGDMPYDQDGRHATGREVFRRNPAGIWIWYPEYEGDDTCNDPVTESDSEYEERLDEMYGELEEK